MNNNTNAQPIDTHKHTSLEVLQMLDDAIESVDAVIEAWQDFGILAELKKDHKIVA